VAWLVVCHVLLLSVASLAFAGDWPMWRYDACHTAASPEELPGTLSLKWTRQYLPRLPVWNDPLNQDLMPYDTVFQPVVMGHRMFLGFNDSDKVVALDMRTGDVLWTFYSGGPVRFSPVAAAGKVYFTSDDGYLYCVDAETENLRWNLRGGPSAQKVLGNQRIISAWPARGGPVLRDNTLYFAASIWPFMGTFVYAVDAETGKVKWLNDSTGADYIKQPHDAPAFAGVAPQGQLAATERLLLVPGGRSLPAVFDRASGRLAYFGFGAKGMGGSFVATDQSLMFVHTRLRGTAALSLSDFRDRRFRVNESVRPYGGKLHVLASRDASDRLAPVLRGAALAGAEIGGRFRGARWQTSDDRQSPYGETGTVELHANLWVQHGRGLREPAHVPLGCGRLL